MRPSQKPLGSTTTSSLPRAATTLRTATTTPPPPTTTTTTTTRSVLPPSSIPGVGTTSRPTMVSRDAQAASRSRLFGSTVPSSTTSTAAVAPRPTLSSRQTTTIPTTTTSTRSALPTRVAPANSLPPSSTTTVPRTTTRPLVKSTLPDATTPVSTTVSRITQRTASVPSTVQSAATAPMSIQAPSRRPSLQQKSRFSSTTSTTASITRTRQISTIAPPVLLPPAELSAEAKALLAQVEDLETSQVNEKYYQTEEQCEILYQQLSAQLTITSSNLSIESIQQFKQRLEAAAQTYETTLFNIRSQQDQYKLNLTTTMNENRIKHQEEVGTIRTRSEQKVIDLTKRVDDLIQEGKQIAVDKLALSKGIMTFNMLINKRHGELDRLTKELTPQQKADILELRKQVMAVMKKRDLFESSKQDQMNKKRQFDEQTEQFIAAELFRRQLHNLLQEIRGSIRVLCRIRPLMQHDGEMEYKTLRYEEEVSQLKLMLKDKEHSYQFDTILGPDSTQFDVFDEVNGVVQSAIDGYDVCLFSYGQTGSGKTWTMTGNVVDNNNKGIIPRSVDLIFDKTHELSSQGWNFDISVSCCQIYQEKIYDLLVNTRSNDKTELKIINDQANKKIIVTDLQIKPVRAVTDVHHLLSIATKNRTVAQTSMNAQSSRSHFVFTLHVTMINTRTNEKRIGNLNLCDLAGSERVSTAKTTGDQFKETQKINLSLSTLNRVFLELSQDNDHIPFRDSKLTDLLQYCLSGNGKTMMIVNLSPTAASAQETNGSLQLAKTVSMIQKGKNKSSVTKNGGSISQGGIIRKQPPQLTQQFQTAVSTTTTVMSDAAQQFQSHQDDSIPATSASSSNNSVRSRLNEFKRVRVQPINIMTGDEDVDNELVSLDQYAENPAPFEIDGETAQLFSTATETIAELQETIKNLSIDSNNIQRVIAAISDALDTIKDLLPGINMESLSHIFSTQVDPQVYIQPQIEIFVSKFEYFKDKLASLCQSIQTSTLELSRKGQNLQLNSLQLELASHQEKIESILMAGQAQLTSITMTLETIQSIQQPLTDILTTLESAEVSFKTEYETISQSFLDELDQLNAEYNAYFTAQRESMVDELQSTQRQFKNLYSTKYLAEIKALEKTSKLFNEVKQDHDNLKHQYELLDGQVKGLDFLKDMKTSDLTPDQYIQQQRRVLQQKRDELVLLEQQCTSYDDELLDERKNKLAKYRHHNQQLEMKIASLGGQDALMHLMTQPTKLVKAVPNSTTPLQQKIYNDDEQPITPSAVPTSMPSSLSSSVSSSTSSAAVAAKPKPLVRTGGSAANNIPTAPVSRPTMASRPIPTATAGTTKPTAGPSSSLTRVAPQRAALRK